MSDAVSNSQSKSDALDALKAFNNATLVHPGASGGDEDEHAESSATPSSPAAVSADAVTRHELEQKILQLEGQLKAKEEKYVYLYSEFDTFKRRATKERADLLKYGWESLARDLLEVIDNLERALSHAAPEAANSGLSQGLQMVLQQFQALLHKQGVEIVPSLGKAFDPHLHEAIGQEASALPAGVIVQEQTKGYTLHQRLLRPARVTLSTGQP